MSKRGMPWLQFFPADWLSDAVQGCSPAAKGIWIDMLCIMHGSERYGYLEADGKPIPDELMFRRCGCASVEEYRNWLAELFSAGVPSRTPEGVIYNRRMVRDQQARDAIANRVRRHREKVACNAPVTPKYAVEVRSHKSEVREPLSSRTVKPPSEEGVALSVLLKGRIISNNPGAKITEPQLGQWAREADLMIRRDGRTAEQIRSLIEWSQSDAFWKTNILSMGKLREKFDQLTVKKNQPKGGANGNHSEAAVRAESGKYAAIPITRATA